MKVQKSACIHTSVCDNSFQVNSELFYSTKGIQTGRKLKKKMKSQRYLTFSAKINYINTKNFNVKEN